MRSHLDLLWACLIPLVAACGEDIDFGPVGGGGEDAGGGGAGGAEVGGGGGSVNDAIVEIHMRSTTATFDHQDGLSGQTPAAHTSGVRSLKLFRDANDPNPATIFDFGQDSVEVSYADGADVLVFTAQASDLPEANFTLARVVHSYVKYRVDATMHASGLVIPGQFDNVQTLSDNSLVDGQLTQSGDYTYVFEGAGMRFPQSGSDAPVPEYEAVGGFSVRFEDGEWAYYFPVNLPVNPDLPEDFAIILEVNMHESYRWMDQTSPGFAAGVFDVTPTTFEPVLQFGANSFDVSVEGL